MISVSKLLHRERRSIFNRKNGQKPILTDLLKNGDKMFLKCNCVLQRHVLDKGV